MSISLHVATQAIRLRRSGTSLNTLRVTLWITTAIHLDTPNITPDSQHDLKQSFPCLLMGKRGLDLELPHS